VTYPPPPGAPDPYGQQQPSQDPYAAPPPYDPTSPPAPPPPAYDPYGQQPVSTPPTPSSPYAAPPATPQNPYDPYAQQQSPAPQQSSPPQYGQPYGQQPYGSVPQYPYGPQAADPSKPNGLSIGAMSTGIASIVLACCCWPLGLAAGVAGMIMGFVSRKQIMERGGQGSGFAMTGIICGAVGILLGIVGAILAFSGVNQNLINDIMHNSGNALY
jgi:hypothetical protein